ncbi:MAG: carboxypeptidase regulatory-like domain-containing protein [Phaeodactylibacter sp.]|nr:carboxypeptidase regulatory-like domain-containing protein [Phaeodactylibacter sp.]
MKKIILFLASFLAVAMAMAQSASISGTILRPDGTVVTGITVNLLNAQGQLVATTGVFGNGLYQFANIPTGQEYTLVPELQGQALLDVSTLDIVMGAQHILGIIQLDSPFRVLAGDVNQSNSLTTLDLALIRQMVLGITTDFPVNWQFFRTDAQFVNDNNPWQGFSGGNDSFLLEEDITGLDFYAVKTGDLSW